MEPTLSAPRRAQALLGLCALLACAAPPPPAPLSPTRVLPHFRRWSPELAQGGQPEGEDGFRCLAQLGFATVLSVDGAVPDAASAARHGLRTVHVPIGYDGISHEQALRLVQAVRTSPGPVYVHCHHGLHRGPAAAAVARRWLGQVDAERATADLAASGCSPDYPGLFRDVAGFVPPEPGELAALPRELPSRVEPQDLQASMIEVDARWGRLEEVRSAGWRTPPDHPDLDPPHEAILLGEALREAARLPAVAEGEPELVELLNAAADAAQRLGRTLRAGGDPEPARAGLGASCKDCHARFRDR